MYIVCGEWAKTCKITCSVIYDTFQYLTSGQVKLTKQLSNYTQSREHLQTVPSMSYTSAVRLTPPFVLKVTWDSLLQHQRNTEITKIMHIVN